MVKITGKATALLLTVALVAFFGLACGDDSGGGQEDGEGAATPAPAGTAPAGTVGSGGGGPVRGPLVHISGFGLFVVDPATGSGRKHEFAGVEDAAANVEPALADGFAFVLTLASREGESYSHDVYLSRLDLAQGGDEPLAGIGFDRESDDAAELFEYPELAVAGGRVWIVRERFGSSEPAELLSFDAETGAPGPVIAVERPTSLVSDGERLYLWTAEGLSVLDPAAGELETLLPAGTAIEEVLAPGVDLEPAFLTESGAALTADDLDFLGRRPVDGNSLGAGLASAGAPLRFLAFGEGALWLNWKATGSTFAGDSVLGEAILRFDPGSRTVDGLVPTVPFGEHFLAENTVSNGGGDLTWMGGSLWVADAQSNGAVLRIDPETLEAELVYEPCREGGECSDQDSVRFNRTDPDGLWIEFARLESQGDGSRVGDLFLVQLDPETGGAVREIALKDLVR